MIFGHTDILYLNDTFSFVWNAISTLLIPFFFFFNLIYNRNFCILRLSFEIMLLELSKQNIKSILHHLFKNKFSVTHNIIERS